MIQITDVRPGAKISRPGFYQIPMEDHHGQPCVGPSVTSGGLRRIERHGPEYFWAYSALNPEALPDVDSPAKKFGRLVAAFVEGGVAGLTAHYKVLPEDAPQRPTAPQIRAFERDGYWSESAEPRAAFYESWDADPREEIAASDMEQLTAMMTALARDPASEIAFFGIPELDMIWQDEETGLWCLSRLDIVGLDGTLVDHKTCTPGAAAFNGAYVDRKITDFGYYQQLALAAEGWEILMGHPPSATGIFMQRTDAPWSTILRNVPADAIEIGRYQNRRARRLIRKGLDTGHWPGPGEEMGSYEMPDWLSKRLRQDMALDKMEMTRDE